MYHDLRLSGQGEIIVGRPSFAVFAFAVAFVSFACAQNQTPDKSAIEKWVNDLADVDFAVRENAQRRLIEAGEAARAAAEAATKSKDVEQRLRAEHVVTELRRRDVWAPTLITFKGENVTVKQLFRVLEEQSGNVVDWKQSAEELGKPLSVDWKGVPLWAAVEEVCSKSKITIQFPENERQKGWILQPATRPVGPVRIEGPLRLQLNLAYRDQDLSMSRGRRAPAKIADKKDDKQEGAKEDVRDPVQHIVRMEFGLDWEKRFPLCRYEGKMRIREAITDTGEDLKVARSRNSRMGVLSQRQPRLTYVEEIKTAKKPVQTLKKLVVELDLVAAGDFVHLTVPVGSRPVSEARGGYTFEFLGLNKLDAKDEITFRIVRPAPYEGVNAVDMVDEYYTTANASGQNIPFSFFQVPKGSNLFANYVIHCASRLNVATVTAHIALLKSRRTVAFTFTDVPIQDKPKDDDD